MKRILLLFLLLPFLSFAQLSGSYIINTANSDTNFKTLAAAVTRINAVGVSGPVVFLLDENQTITSRIEIKKFTGSSTTNTLIIKPNVGKDISINANMLNNSTGIAAVFMLNGASNIVIDGSNSIASTKNLTLINNDNLSYTNRSIIWVASNGTTGSSNITVKNNILKFTYRNSNLTLCTGVYSGNNGVGGDSSIDVQASTALNTNVSVVNNSAINVKDAIYINGSDNASISPSNWKIQANIIGSTVESEKPVRGIYLSNALSYEISGNTISGIKNNLNNGNDTAAIVLLGTSSGVISNNDITNIANSLHNNSTFTAGILIKSTGSTNIYNNLISNVYVSTADSNNYNYYNKAHGIFITLGSSTNIYYNTIVMNGAPSGTAYSSCLYTTGGSNINVKNNIFVNSQSNSQYAIFKNGGTIASISNNDYYITNATNTFSNRNNSTEYIGTTGFTSWNSAVSDSNSKSISPKFISTTDFHLQNISSNNNLQGIAISGITTDIDGQNRVKPYMGADEICAGPSITTQPTTPAASCSGNGTQIMTVVATGATSYQWRKEGMSLSNSGVVSGATTATLTLTNPTALNEGSYDVLISSSCLSTVVSNAVNVTIIPDPIINANIIDASCSNTSSGSITLTNPDSAIEFKNADSDYIDLGSSFSLSNRSAFTLEGWVKFNKSDIGNRYSLFGQNDVIEFGFTNNNNILLWTAGGGSVTTPLTSDFGDNTWHHIAAVGDGSKIKIYIDGMWVVTGGSTTSNYGSSSAYTPKIGGGVIDAAGGGFTGQIKKVGIYSTALSSDTIAALASSTIQYTGSEAGLLAGYNFSEGTGTMLTKLPLGINGTFQKSPEWNYNYSWTKTGTASYTASTRNINLLSAGSYNLTLTSVGVSCSFTKSFTVGGGSTLLTPALGTSTQPNCVTPSGSIVLSGLPSTGTINQTGSAVQSYVITATSMTISGLVPGSYNFAVTSSGCSSGTTTAVVINSAVTNTWNGTMWSKGTPTINQRLVFTGDYLNSNDVDLIGCSCTVENGVKVTIKKERYMKIKNGVVVTGTGTLTFEDQSSLVQINDAAINSGNITYKRETTAIDKFDYTYWSTPVKNQRLIDVSPTTSGDKFLSFDSSVNNWKYETNTNIMTPGKGYIIRGPEAHNAPNPPSTYEASFIGEPNNGVVSVAIAGTRVSNLMGNPYPSAVSADAFLMTNNSVLSGTLYFWTHNTDIGTGVSNPGTGAYAYSSDDYASYNLTGGTGTSAVSGGSTPLANTSIPTGEIAAGQSFFGTSIVPGTATFNNSMRLDSGVVIDNTQFFKQVSSSKETSVVEKNRLWLDLMNDQGAFKQTLIGYITGATNDYESAYDGSSFNANAYVNFYSLQGTSAMAIQGRALPFDQSDIVPLGYKSTIAGDFKIAIDQVDGFFTSQVVYLEDKLLSVIHNLNDSPYAFTTEIGVFDDRFVISYANKTLATDDFETINNTVFIASKDKAITITASDDLIDKVYVYDFSGRQLYSRTKVASERLLIPNIIAGDQALIVKVILQNGKVITKKINY
ncbi:LamG-like jellyroll fold domain-containing protein [Flavobacterium sp. PL002]|uniref:LamG-like jellyroll fold domain-containing protein n=1 Tax=Flavobacterium sp. PL002 TaxID=1897058 RepID=UPI001787CE4A|nr:LamG-like jellyroll fold domain-containing protein [Flavobacterium sp. PL002]MBE0390360.1 hypothetical protein [Flavobacterium sp. PL002]